MPGGAAGGAGEGGAGGTSGMPPPAPGTLIGTVTTIVEPDLSRSGDPGLPVEIRVARSTGDDIVATSNTDGSFSLDGAPRDPGVWVAVGTFTDSTTETFMDTLQVVDTTVEGAVELVIMRRSVLEELISSTFFDEPIELDPARGHVILRCVDELGNPIPGLSVVSPSAEVADVAYDAGDIYSDVMGETSTRGTVALMNLPAADYPGGLTTVVLELSSMPVVQFRPNVRVASDSVTVLTVALDLAP